MATPPADPVLSGGPVRVLNIQLHPDELGTVTVHLRLSGQAISTQIRASNAETARLLEFERQNLADLLREAGYDAELPAVQAAGREALPPANEAASLRGANSAANTDASNWSSERGGNGAGPEGRSGGRDQNQPFRRESNKNDATTAGSLGADDLYV